MGQHLIDLMLASRTDYIAGIWLMAELSVFGFAFITTSFAIVSTHEVISNLRKRRYQKYAPQSLLNTKAR